MKTFHHPIAAAAVLALFVAGCGKDDPISPEEDHYEAEGLVLIDSGNRFFRYFRGEIDSDDGRADILEVPHGQLTPHWSIRFLDADGNEMAPPSGEGTSFTWVIADPSVVEVFQDEGDEGKFDFHLRGLEEGETTIVLQIAHEGHVDFRTQPIPVHVVEEFEAEGLVLIDSGNRFFRYFRGEIDSDDGRAEYLEAPIGLTAHWSVKFLDSHGDEIDPPDDPEFTFGWTIDDPSVVEVFQDEGDEGKFDFHLRGLKEGETTIMLQVDHEGHVDFRTLPIPVHVVSQAGQHGEPVGLRLKDEDSGQVLVQASREGKGDSTGVLAVAVGDTTDHIATVFFDDQDVEFQPEAPDETLGIAVADTSLLGIDPPVAPDYWAFKLIGKKAGTTTITLSIVHDGQAEHTFVPISVVISAQSQ